MRSVLPSQLLKFALLADALVSGAVAAMQLLFLASLPQLLGLPKALLQDSGLFLGAYVALLLLLATRQRLWSALVGLVVIVNIGWALGCVALMLSGALAPTALGLAYLAVHATGPLLFSALELLGLRRSASAGEGGPARAY